MATLIQGQKQAKPASETAKPGTPAAQPSGQPELDTSAWLGYGLPQSSKLEWQIPVF